MKLIKQLTATASICDFRTKLSLLGSVQIVQDVFSEYMGELGLDGISVKQKYNAMWVFAKNSIKIFDEICWGDTFDVECFVSSISTVTMIVDTVFKKDGKIVFCSKLEVCPLDIKNQRIVKLSSVGIDENFKLEAPYLNYSPEKLASQDLFELKKVKIEATNIDFSIHTNNTEYVRILLNAFDIETLKKQISEFEINYVSQSHFGDELSLKMDQNNSLALVNNENRTVVRAKFVFKN